MTLFESPEGATPIDLDEMTGLKMKHISNRSELNRFEQENIREALEWLERRRKENILSEKFIKTLHQKMFGKVWTWAGVFRKSNKNIGVDWHQIQEQLRVLLEDVQYWIDNNVFENDEMSIRFHHRLVWIHLFTNGNGRHSRLMTDVFRKEILHEEPFIWNIRYLEDENQVRALYLTALREADKNNFLPLLEFVRSN